tara:strand:+ start:197 stop:469 length:273 start_codon:yes stop_codon:yes gene_type:complete
MSNPFEVIEKKLDGLQQLMLDHIKSQHSSNVAEEDIGGIDTAIKVTGLSKHTIYGLVSRKKIPYHKTSAKGKLFFKRSELINWIESNKTQ